MDPVSVFLLKGVVVILLLMGPLRVSSHEYGPATVKGVVFDRVAVEGVVYCKPCKYQGVETLLGASPITGAVVKLECQNRQTLYATTDKNGYFFLYPMRNYKFGEENCGVYLVSSPEGLLCNKATNLHYGQSGAGLSERTMSIPVGADFYLARVGPFAFEPSSCPR